MTEEVLQAVRSLKIRDRKGNINADVLIPMAEALLGGQAAGIIIFLAYRALTATTSGYELSIWIGAVIGCSVFAVYTLGDRLNILIGIWRIGFTTGKASEKPKIDRLKNEIVNLKSRREVQGKTDTTQKDIAERVTTARIAGEIALTMIERAVQGGDISRRSMDGTTIKAPAGSIFVNQLNWKDAHSLLVEVKLKTQTTELSLTPDQFDSAQDAVIAAVTRAVAQLQKGETPAWMLRR